MCEALNWMLLSDYIKIISHCDNGKVNEMTTIHIGIHGHMCLHMYGCMYSYIHIFTIHFGMSKNDVLIGLLSHISHKYY